jgi:hypothetical protein
MPIDENILAQVAALRIVTTLLLADKFGDHFDPVQAGERFIKNVFDGLSGGASTQQQTSIRISEEIASLAHEAARIAEKRELKS